MVKLQSWSTTAANNNSAAPNGLPEGMDPGDVNDSVRQNMALLKGWYEDAGWVHLHNGATYASGSTFTFAGVDLTAVYTQGRRIKVIDNDGTKYGTITGSVFSTDTTVTVALDGAGSIADPVTRVEPSILTAKHQVEASATLTVNPQTDTYTIVGSDNGKVVTINKATAVTVTLPEANTEALPGGFHCTVIQLGAGQVTLAKEGSDAVLAPGGLKTRVQGSELMVKLLSAGTPNTYHVIGDATT